MAPILQPRSKEYLTDLERTCLGMFLQGQCYIFATALHRGLGWPIIGLMQGTVVQHALVKNPEDQTLHDVRGLVSGEEIGRPFNISPPYDLQPLEESDLFKQARGSPSRLSETTSMAEELFPDLPWKNSLKERALKFAEELEALSHKHGLWIRELVPAAPPLLVQRGKGEVKGYLLRREGFAGETLTITSR